MAFVLVIKMQRLFLISALCAGLFTGCATTSKLIPFVGSETPMQQVLKAQPEIVKEHNNTSVQQVFNRVESPTVSRITVIQTGLMDDSVSAIRTEYSFKLVDVREGKALEVSKHNFALKNKKDDKYIVFFYSLNYTPLSKILILTSTTSSLTAS